MLTVKKEVSKNKGGGGEDLLKSLQNNYTNEGIMFYSDLINPVYDLSLKKFIPNKEGLQYRFTFLLNPFCDTYIACKR